MLDTSEGTTVVIGDTSFTIFESGYIEENYYDVDEINALLAEKQDVLTAGTNIAITNNVISTADTLNFDVIDCGKAPGPVDGV